MSKHKNSLEFEKPLLELEKQLDDLVNSSKNSDLDFSDEIQAIESKIELTKREVYADLSPWQKVQLSRHPNRPYTNDYIERVFTNFEPFMEIDCIRRMLLLLVDLLNWMGKKS